jgi:hypothetical protein
MGSGILGGSIAGLIAGTTLLWGPCAHAAQTNLVGWGSYNSATTTFPLAATSHAAAISSATLSYYQTFKLNDGRGVWGAANQSTTLDVTTAPYIDWTINFNTGLGVTNAIFFLDLAKLDTPTKLQLSYSIDNYATSLGSLSSVNTSYQNFMFSLGSTPLSGTVDFRLYFYDVSSRYATNSTYNNVYNVGCFSSYSTIGGTYSTYMNNFTAGLLGNITSIPEPAGCVLAGFGLALCYFYRRLQG